MPANALPVLVSGAGMRELAAAIALGRAGMMLRSWKCDLRKSPKGRAVLPGNALRALRFSRYSTPRLRQLRLRSQRLLHSDGKSGDIPCRITAHDTPLLSDTQERPPSEFLQAAASKPRKDLYQTTIDQVVTCDDTALVRFTGGRMTITIWSWR